MKHTAEAELATKLSACVRACTPKEPDAHCGRSQGHHAHQLARPNFAFVPVLRRSNPGCNITILTDQATQFAGLPPGVQVFRYAAGPRAHGPQRVGQLLPVPRAAGAPRKASVFVPVLLCSGSICTSHEELFCLCGFSSVAPVVPRLAQLGSTLVFGERRCG